MQATAPTRKPWGRKAGILMACLITLIGVIADLDPDVVLGRAVLGGSVCGIFAAILAACWVEGTT